MAVSNYIIYVYNNYFTSAKRLKNIDFIKILDMNFRNQSIVF